ncbi:MAG: hypothetical protein OEQ18_13365 [Gammaproteobacteria bacterium]|nr:hypothetical protein [Gammaproteobacteria bacterium]
MRLTRSVLLMLLGLGLTAAQPVVAGTIKKCQDAHGKWHYGDFAAQACAQTKITEIDNQGLKVKEQDAPPTAAELQERRDQAADAEKAATAARERELLRKRILGTYDSEESIVRTRDNRVKALNQAIETDRKLRGRLVARLNRIKRDQSLADDAESVKHQIAEYDNAILSKEEMRQSIVARFAEELALYRSLISRAPDTPR